MALTNPLGAQAVFDGEVPRTFTASAMEIISGGHLVNVSGASGDVGSQISSYGNGDLRVLQAINPKLCNGIALNNAASGALVSVATRGAYFMLTAAIVSGGALVKHNASGAIANWTAPGSTVVTAIQDTPIGRALTTSASGTANFALVKLNL